MGWSSLRDLIVHYPHHKCGTLWFNNIFSDLSKEFGWKYQYCTQDQLEDDTILWVVEGETRVFWDKLRSYKGSHMIRDPRDMIVSGYFYHLHCDEDHITANGYQEQLKAMSKEVGINIDMRRAASYSATIMLDWVKNTPENFIEFRYEDLWKNEISMFRQIFEHYGFSEKEIGIALGIVDKNSFSNMKDDKHIRKGELRQWKEHLTSFHKIILKRSHFQNLLEVLQYEKDKNW